MFVGLGGFFVFVCSGVLGRAGVLCFFLVML